MSKSVVVVFKKNSVEGEWKWGEHKLPIMCQTIVM